jgi:branched-chain amino acid transport system substrate-binding protein
MRVARDGSRRALATNSTPATLQISTLKEEPNGRKDIRADSPCQIAAVRSISPKCFAGWRCHTRFDCGFRSRSVARRQPRHQNRPHQPEDRSNGRFRGSARLDARRRSQSARARASDRWQNLQVEFIAKDSQTDESRTAELANELILKDKVDIITASAGSINCNPTANVAELNEVPCITTNNPWESYYYGRNPPKEGFTYTYHFFWGLKEILACFIGLWKDQDTNKVVGTLFNTAQDDNDWHNAFIPAIKAAGFTVVDPGQFPAFGNDFTPQVTAFKKAGVQIVSGNLFTPDFAGFYNQCAQMGYQPKIITLGKAFLFPSDVAALGPRGVGVTSEVWWTPDHPFKSSLTGISSKDLGATYEKATGKHWTQPIPYVHALCEVVVDVLKRSKDPKDPKSILEAITTTDVHTIVGHVKWTGQPVKNVCVTPVVAGQWQKHGDRLDIAIVNSGDFPEIKTTSKLLPLA